MTSKKKILENLVNLLNKKREFWETYDDYLKTSPSKAWKADPEKVNHYIITSTKHIIDTRLESVLGSKRFVDNWWKTPNAILDFYSPEFLWSIRPDQVFKAIRPKLYN